MKKQTLYLANNNLERICSFSLLLFFILLGNCLNAQMLFQSLSENRDLSFGKIFQIKTGLNGMSWIASDGGIMRYNSKDIFKYTRGNGLPEKSENTIRKIIIDKEGVVWATSNKQLLHYNEITDNFDIAASATFSIKAITEDENGNIWVSGNSGLYMYDVIQKELKLYASGNVEFISGINEYVYYFSNGMLFNIHFNTKEIKQIASFPAVINSMYARNNTIHIGLFNGSVYEYKNALKPKKVLELDGPVVDIEYNNDHYYFAIDLKGIRKHDSNLSLIELYYNNPEKSIWVSGPKIFDIEFDREGQLWVAQYNFGLKYPNPFFVEIQNFEHIPNDEKSLRESFTRVIEEDEKNRLWFGTKIGLSIFEPETNNWIQFPNFNEYVLDIESVDDYMLVSTYRGGLFEISKSDLTIKEVEEDSLPKDAFDYIFQIEKLYNGDLIFARLDQPILIKKKEGEYISLIDHEAISIVQNDETIYLGNSEQVNKLNILNYETKPIVKLSSSKYLYSRINSFTYFKEGILLVATSGAGLLICDNDKDSIIQINKSSGLLTDNVLNINIINDTTLLAATDNGLSKINMVDNKYIVTNFTKGDGFINNNYLEKAFSKLHDGRFAYGGTEGVSIFDPNILLRKDSIPPIFFESIQSDNKNYLVDSKLKNDSYNNVEKIVLPPGNHSISIDFTTIQNSRPELLSYSYKLEGLDKKWSIPTKLGNAKYQLQKSGNYTFRVHVSNDGLNWTNERTIKLRIKPFWWESNLAYLFYFLIFCALIYAYYFITNQIREKKNVLNQLDFFSNTIHEVKTPLSILISSLSREERKNDKVNVDKIRGTISRLSSLFEQMLNFQSVIYKDSDLVAVDEIELKSYIQDVIDDFQPMLEMRNLIFEVDTKEIHSKFYFNLNGLNKIMYNLISNAIKYSKEGGTISIKLEQLANENLHLEIKDNGIGIPKNQQPNIFKRFYRAKNVQNSNFTGTGLGLLIVKSIIDKTQGSIQFKSVENEGTTFFVELKNFEKEFEQLENKSVNIVAVPKNSDYNDVRVLLVEDNDELREELSKHLSLNYTVYEARNGKEAFSFINNETPDIIITDLIMPEMDGIELTKKVKENVEFSHIPIIMLSVLRDKKQVFKGLEVGIVEFMYKPVDPNLLIAKVNNLLKWQNDLKAKYLNESEIGEAFDTRNKADQEFIENLENYVVTNVLKNISVTDLSEEIGLSRTSLYNKLKKLIDISPQDFIILTKLKLAKKELRNTDKTIKEIAFDTGFFDQSHLSRSFKKAFSQSPSSYRNEIQNKISQFE